MLYQRHSGVVCRASNQPAGRVLSTEPTLPPSIASERSRLLARLSQTLRNPSLWKFGKRAAEARALGHHALIAARGSAQADDLKALNGIIVGAETLGSDLMHARMILQGKSMQSEFDLLGAFVPTIAAWFVLSLAMFVAVDALLTWCGFYRLFWHAPLARFALFLCLFCGGGLVVGNH